jgi:glucose-6-phosphate 1-dehydrogenase
MKFSYTQTFGQKPPADEYERLLLDTIRGDATLFARTDGIAASWSFITKILNNWRRPEGSARREEIPLYTYAPGTWGPPEADTFIEADSRHWFLV